MIVRVTAEIWIDTEVLKGSGPGWDTDSSDDPKFEAEYLVRCATDALPGLVECRYAATKSRSHKS